MIKPSVYTWFRQPRCGLKSPYAPPILLPFLGSFPLYRSGSYRMFLLPCSTVLSLYNSRVQSCLLPEKVEAYSFSPSLGCVFVSQFLLVSITIMFLTSFPRSLETHPLFRLPLLPFRPWSLSRRGGGGLTAYGQKKALRP